MAVLTERFDDALLYARSLHATQLRKGTTIPYFSHLMAVSALVLEAGGDEDMAIAALLHDAAEDQGGEPTLHAIEARFGAKVAGIVRQCSDSLNADPKNKSPWVARKAKYIKHLRAATDPGSLLVGCADKLHNARAILVDLRTHGDAVWARFVADGEKTAGQVIGYYLALGAAYEELLGEWHPLAREFSTAVALIWAESDIEADRRWEREA